MKKLNKTLVSLSFLALITCLQGFAQVGQFHYFQSGLQGELTSMYQTKLVDDGIIITTKLERSGSVEPVMLKVNFSGVVQWTTLEDHVINTSACSGFTFDVFEDGYIYGTSYHYVYPDNLKFLWKVNAQTGKVSWSKFFYPEFNNSIGMADFDDQTFVMAYPEDDYSSRLAVVSKATGDTLRTKLLESARFSNLELVVDDNRNTYFGNGTTLTKFSLNNFGNVIWKREFNDLDEVISEIHHVYLDDYDNIFVFGRDGGSFGHGGGIITKVDPSTGLSEWISEATPGSLALSDFKDYNDTLYATYRHTLVGGGTYLYTASKVAKSDGAVAWRRAHKAEPVGIPSSGSGNSQAAIGLDVNCEGDVYLTGYYGDANYGGAAWGSMKLDGSNGDKLYDITVTEDTVAYDEGSTGLSTYIVDDQPIVLGRLEKNTGGVVPYLAHLDKTIGQVTHGTEIGARYHPISQTMDIINKDNKVYVLKQKGKVVMVEKYDPNGNEIWTRTLDAANNALVAGQIAISSSSVYLTTSVIKKGSAEGELILFQLNESTGSLNDSSSFRNESYDIAPYELEVDENSAFVFYVEEYRTRYRSWTSGLFSESVEFGYEDDNFEFLGQLDLIWQNATSLFYIDDEIHEIDKATLTNSRAAWLGSSSNIYSDYVIHEDTLYLAGESNSRGVVLAYDLVNEDVLWTTYYDNDTKFYRIVMDDEHELYIGGILDSTIHVKKIDRLDEGAEVWSYSLDSDSLFPSSLSDMAILPVDMKIGLTGIQYHSSGRTDVLIQMIDLNGNPLMTHHGADGLNDKSIAYSIEAVSDTSFWVGGALNTKFYSRRGFIYSVGNSGINTALFSTFGDDSHISIYPNPSHGAITVEGTSSTNFRYSVIDLLGKQVFASHSKSDNDLNLDFLRPGAYVIQLTDGDEFYSKSLIIE